MKGNMFAAFGAHAALTCTTMNATKIHLSSSFSAQQPKWPRLPCLPPSPAPPWLPESNRAPRLSPRIGQRRSPRPTDPSDELVYDDGCLNLRGSLWPHEGSQPTQTTHDEVYISFFMDLTVCIVVLSKTHSYTHKWSHVSGTADWSIGSLCWFHFLGQFKTHCSQTLTVHKDYKYCWPQIHWRKKKKHWCHQCGLTELHTHTHTLESWSLCADNYKSTKETLWDRNEIEPVCFTPVWQDLLDFTGTTTLHLWTINPELQPHSCILFSSRAAW